MTETDEVKKYVCFIKRRTGAKFIPYTLEGSGELVVKTLREFLDHEVTRWSDPAVLLRVTYPDFVNDVESEPVNSKYAAMLGWNYPAAARLVETDGAVYILTVHPRFESKPFSYRQVKDDDAYALEFVRAIWSLRGGTIAFEKYDPAKHVPGCEYEG